MSNQLALEIIALSSGLRQFGNFQVLNIAQANGIIALSPELIVFASTCGNCDNTLAQVFGSNLNIDFGNLNLGGCNVCLQQVLGLQALSIAEFVSGNNTGNVGNNTGNANDTANAIEDDVAADEEEVVVDEDAAADNETAIVDENADDNVDENADENAEEVIDEDANNQEGDITDTQGRKKMMKFKGKRSPAVVQRSGASAKAKVMGSAVFGMLLVGLHVFNEHLGISCEIESGLSFDQNVASEDQIIF
ncbi:hypothetical protein VTL71DRAFT_6703 [Oculimacula yallundae]|uniref:Uncharacterized protein n=1 Tax=Oculimacula yallundae TaxID=86028 RepID=A0ABR4BXT2_9HELO